MYSSSFPVRDEKNCFFVVDIFTIEAGRFAHKNQIEEFKGHILLVVLCGNQIQSYPKWVNLSALRFMPPKGSEQCNFKLLGREPCEKGSTSCWAIGIFRKASVEFIGGLNRQQTSRQWLRVCCFLVAQRALLAQAGRTDRTAWPKPQPQDRWETSSGAEAGWRATVRKATKMGVEWFWISSGWKTSSLFCAALSFFFWLIASICWQLPMSLDLPDLWQGMPVLLSWHWSHSSCLSRNAVRSSFVLSTHCRLTDRTQTALLSVYLGPRHVEVQDMYMGCKGDMDFLQQKSSSGLMRSRSWALWVAKAYMTSRFQINRRKTPLRNRAEQLSQAHVCGLEGGAF